MDKFKLQKLISIIPVYSTIIISVVTMLQLKKRSAQVREWIDFALCYFISGFIIFALQNIVLTALNPFLRYLVCGLVLAAANFHFIALQQKI